MEGVIWVFCRINNRGIDIRSVCAIENIIFISELSICFRSCLELVDRLSRCSMNFVLLDIVEPIVEEVGLFYVKAVTSEVFFFVQINSLVQPLLFQIIVLKLKLLQFFSFFIGLLYEFK